MFCATAQPKGGGGVPVLPSHPGYPAADADAGYFQLERHNRHFQNINDGVFVSRSSSCFRRYSYAKPLVTAQPAQWRCSQTITRTSISWK